MSRQVLGPSEVLLGATAAANGAPAGAAGIHLQQTFPDSTPLTIDWLLRIRMSADAAPEGDFHLWGRDEEDTVWGTLGNDDGMLNGGNTIVAATAAYVGYFIITNIGLFERLYLELRNPVGANFSCQAELFPFYNCEASGLIS